MSNRTILITLIVLFCATGVVSSQDHTHHQIIDEIEQQVAGGQLSYEEGLIKRFEIAYGKHEAPDELLTLQMDAGFNTDNPYRCLTPLNVEFHNRKDELSAQTRETIEQMMEPASLQRTAATYTPPDSIFTIRFYRSGTNALDTTDTSGTGVPDYVERVAEIADSSYKVLVEENGYKDPRAESQDLYEIEIRNLRDGIYGETRSISEYPSTKIIIRNNYEGFPDNDDPEGNELGALKATLAHEVQHAIQYQYTEWNGPSGNFDWIEMDAVMMEDIVFPYVNDYQNYLSSVNSIFSRPHEGPPGAYWQSTWFLYYYHLYGVDFWRDAWELLGDDYTRTFPEAKAMILGDEKLRLERVRNHLWHLSAGEHSLEDYGFPDRESYPEAMLTENEVYFPEGFQREFTLNDFDARYYKFQPDEKDSGPLKFGLFSDGEGLAAGLLGVKKSGEVKELLIPTSENDPDLINTGWEVSDLKEVRLVMTGTHENKSGSFRFVTGAGEHVESVAYGDFKDDGDVEQDDVHEILEHLLSNDFTSSSQLLRGDVSGNRFLSTFDGSLILRYLDGNLDTFPVDESETGFGPEASAFEQVDPPLARANQRVNPNSVPDVVWKLELQNDQPGTQSTIDIDLSMEFGDDKQVEAFYSLLLEFEVPEWLVLEEIEKFQTLQSSLSAYSRDADTLRVAVSGRELFTEGDLFSFKFEAFDHRDSEVKLTNVRLDEFQPIPSAATTGSFEIDESVVVGADQEQELPDQLTLNQNYPNPFNPVTTIEFDLPESGQTKLTVYDISGREITTLVDENLNAGTHQYTFDGSDLSSGVYIYRVETPVGSRSGKMTLIK